jgi:hypothetical protein
MKNLDLEYEDIPTARVGVIVGVNDWTTQPIARPESVERFTKSIRPVEIRSAADKIRGYALEAQNIDYGFPFDVRGSWHEWLSFSPPTWAYSASELNVERTPLINTPMDAATATLFWNALARVSTFVNDVVGQFDANRAALALDTALPNLVRWVDENDYSSLNALFFLLSSRVVAVKAVFNDANQTFPREGSLWIACMTLTKKVRANVAMRSAFALILRAFVYSIDTSPAADRLLRNIY